MSDNVCPSSAAVIFGVWYVTSLLSLSNLFAAAPFSKKNIIKNLITVLKEYIINKKGKKHE